MSCPCCSGKTYEDCCKPVIAGTRAVTPEALMRSRYAAMVIGDLAHIEATCTEKALENFDRIELEHSLPRIEWQGLEVMDTERSSHDASIGTVHFRFRYRFGGRDHVQREIATFRQIDGLWLYDTSEINPKSSPVKVERIGRNDPCSCGSGKKHKKCCGNSPGTGAA